MSSKPQETKEVRIVCPICKSEKKLEISRTIISKSNNLTIISIPKDEICEHHFQAFIDKDFKVRGYQKVDFEIEHKKTLPKGDFGLKVIITGNYSVGKSSIIRRFVDNQFQESYMATLGVQISKKSFEFGEGTTIKFLIWDVAGQIKTMAPQRGRFYDGANAAFIVLDRTREGNLKSVNTWYGDIKNSIEEKIPIIIVGNKSDLSDKIVITEEEIKAVADELGFQYLLTSAKTGDNINDAFMYIGYKYLERQ